MHDINHPKFCKFRDNPEGGYVNFLMSLSLAMKIPRAESAIDVDF